MVSLVSHSLGVCCETMLHHEDHARKFTSMLFLVQGRTVQRADIGGTAAGASCTKQPWLLGPRWKI